MMNTDDFNYAGSDFTNEALMDLLAIVDDRKWGFGYTGQIEDREGNCPLCALAKEIDPTIRTYRNVALAIAFLFNPSAEARKALIQQQEAEGKDREAPSWHDSIRADDRIGHITFSADCPLGPWRDQLITILRVEGDPEEAARRWKAH